MEAQNILDPKIDMPSNFDDNHVCVLPVDVQERNRVAKSAAKVSKWLSIPDCASVSVGSDDSGVSFSTVTDEGMNIFGIFPGGKAYYATIVRGERLHDRITFLATNRLFSPNTVENVRAALSAMPEKTPPKGDK